jgi:hypothetical protein
MKYFVMESKRWCYMKFDVYWDWYVMSSLVGYLFMLQRLHVTIIRDDSLNILGLKKFK